MTQAYTPEAISTVDNEDLNRINPVEMLIANPFPTSAVQRAMYYGRFEDEQFERDPNFGFHVVEVHDYAEEYLGPVVLRLYVNVQKPYTVSTEEELNDVLDHKSEFFNRVRSEGYDAVWIGLESGHLYVLDAEAVNAYNGLPV